MTHSFVIPARRESFLKKDSGQARMTHKESLWAFGYGLGSPLTGKRRLLNIMQPESFLLQRNDADDNGFCDTPYYFEIGAADNKPWTKVNWHTTGTLIEIADIKVWRFLNLGQIETKGIAMSLSSKLNTALRALYRDDVNAVRSLLQAFTNQVQAQSGKQILVSGAEVLLQYVNEINAEMALRTH